MNLNTNTGVIKEKRNRSIVVEWPRGGTFTFKTNREFKIGDQVCFTVDTVLSKVTDVIPKEEADTVDQVAEAEAWPGAIGNMDDLALEDDHTGFELDSDNLQFVDEEDPIDGDTIDGKGQELEGSFDFSCGEDRETLNDPADYFAAGDTLEEPDGSTG